MHVQKDLNGKYPLYNIPLPSPLANCTNYIFTAILTSQCMCNIQTTHITMSHWFFYVNTATVGGIGSEQPL